MIKQTAYLIYNLISLDHSIERVGLRLQWFIYGTLKNLESLKLKRTFRRNISKSDKWWLAWNKRGIIRVIYGAYILAFS